MVDSRLEQALERADSVRAQVYDAIACEYADTDIKVRLAAAYPALLLNITKRSRA